MKYRNLWIAVATLIAPSLLAGWMNYSSVKTANFEVFYRQGWETEAYNLLQSMEYSRPFVEQLTGNRLGRIPFVIEDMGGMANGYTNPVGTKISVFAYPPTNNELSLGEDWWQMVGMHEYIHMAQVTRVSGSPALVRALFGNLFYPGLYQPMWMTQGITVFGESNLSPYSGRLNAGTYNAIINALAREGKLPSPTKAGYYSHGTPQANHYVYGGSFFQYLAKNYGEDKFSQLYGITSSSLATYLNYIVAGLTLDQHYKAVYGKTLHELWEDWQLTESRNSYELPQEKLTPQGWNSSNLKYDKGALYYLNYKVDKTGPSSGFSAYRLIRLSDPEGTPHEEELLQQSSEFSAGYQIRDNTIYYSRSELKTGYDNNEYDGYGVFTELWRMNLDGGNRAKLTEGDIRSFCVLDDGLLLLSEDDPTHQNSILFTYNPATRSKTEVGRLNHLVSSMVYDKGKLYAAARGFCRNSSIFQLQLSPLELIPLIDTPHLEHLVSVEHDKLIFDAVYEGKNGSYLYKLDSKELFHFSGFSEVKNTVQTPSGKTYFLGINGKGSDIYCDQLQLKPFKLPAVEATAPFYSRIEDTAQSLILDKYPVRKGSYAGNLTHLIWPRMFRFPVIEGTQDSLILGASMSGNDILGDFPLWSATILYNYSLRKWGYQLGLENYFFRPLKHSIEFKDMDNKSFSSTQYVTLSQRLNYGLTYSWAGFGFTTADDLERKVWYPFLGMNFSYPGIRIQTNNSLMYETEKFLPSDRGRLGWQGRMRLRLKAPLASELRSNVHIAYDPDADPDEVFSRIRGYDKDWDFNRGATIGTSWYKPIIKIREGIWNPNLYLEDINLGLFYDVALPWDRNPNDFREAYGAELIAEISVGFMYSFNLGARYSFNRDGKQLLTLILGI